MNACPLLLQKPGFPKGHMGHGTGSGDRPWCCAFHWIIVFCPGTNCLSTKTNDGLIKTKHKKIFYPSFANLVYSLHSPVQVLLTWLWKDLSSGKCRFTGDTLDLDMHIQKPTAVFVSSFPGTDTPGKTTCKNQELITRMPEIQMSGTPYWQHGHMLDFF